MWKEAKRVSRHKIVKWTVEEVLRSDSAGYPEESVITEHDNAEAARLAICAAIVKGHGYHCLAHNGRGQTSTLCLMLCSSNALG